jgi:hypothetical protein
VEAQVSHKICVGIPQEWNGCQRPVELEVGSIYRRIHEEILLGVGEYYSPTTVEDSM